MSDWLKRFCIEEHRERRRKRLNRSLFSDILWYSSTYDYRVIRFIYNFPIGFALGVAVYHLGWQRLNFADFHPVYSLIFQWSLICGCAFAFAFSPIFRCATICVCVGGLGKSGQGVLSLYLAEQLNRGPISNILNNFELTSSIVVCHLELEADLATERLQLTTGPLEALFEKHFGTAASYGQKFVKILRALIEPFRDELLFSNEEDQVLAAVIDGSEALSERESSLNGQEIDSNRSSFNETHRPPWTKLKSELGRQAGRRMEERCEQTFAIAIRRCHEVFAETQARCYDKLPLIGYLVCWQFNAMDICQPSDVKKFADVRCESGGALESEITPDLDSQMEKLENVSQQLNEQLRLNVSQKKYVFVLTIGFRLHFRAVEQPQDERVRVLNEIKSKIRADVKFFELLSKTLNELLSTLLILLIYCIFRDSIALIRGYLNDIEFKNFYLTSYFWRIDRKRQTAGLPFLEPLNRAETRRHKLRSPYSPPSIQEVRQSWQPLFRFGIFLFITTVIVLVDHYFYRILYDVVSYGKTQATQRAEHTVDIQLRRSPSVDGHGPVADLIRSIVSFNYTNQIHRNITNEECLLTPRRPNWNFTLIHIFGPLIGMLLLQVLFGYVIRRLVLFYVLGWIFRKRSKARIVQLYNRILLARENDRRVGRSRIRFLVEQRRFRQKLSYQRPFLNENHWLRRYLIDRVFSTGRCVLCEAKSRPPTLLVCDRCPATYCRACAESLNGECYACEAEWKDPTTVTRTEETQDRGVFVVRMKNTKKVRHSNANDLQFSKSCDKCRLEIQKYMAKLKSDEKQKRFWKKARWIVYWIIWIMVILAFYSLHHRSHICNDLSKLEF